MMMWDQKALVKNNNQKSRLDKKTEDKLRSRKQVLWNQIIRPFFQENLVKALKPKLWFDNP